ncbi:16760_t:CDS:2 [Funneliformis caledonium]|uniref:16760_t:CDS:1 n=1 Tax=Funneliformis caledonium TaxID=1117310 RepID=A0A9N8WAR4_9GLOM|nr:16760_t:CDS:2 [Funneliformis caledonium]
MKTLNKLLKTVPKNRARVYLVQSFSKDFEQFANDLKNLMNWQADVLSTAKAVNKAIVVYNTRGDDTPLKKKAENRNQTSSPESPCPGGLPSELPP